MENTRIRQANNTWKAFQVLTICYLVCVFFYYLKCGTSFIPGNAIFILRSVTKFHCVVCSFLKPQRQLDLLFMSVSDRYRKCTLPDQKRVHSYQLNPDHYRNSGAGAKTGT